ncbi:hydrogenase maturation protease [Nakamurella panacisegetis]|uniref:Hydrogenase maturation protease n=1 Tax=Nakamurella panacisegetis TaxID=1090615 RepID=A0A1H0QQN0_9ACTN|nr:hydrogenase maturation protease [Nakamurella panacisegetis]SDP19049.1 hydrogenase maturation protease [Nakamurella panacisegetis]
MTASPIGLPPALLVGLGRPDRGDDGVGPVVALDVAALRLPGVQVLERVDPTSLIDLWTDRETTVVVDAVCSNGIPGTLIVLESGADDPRLPDGVWSGTGRGGTHAFGLAAAVELSRALHRLPRRLVLIGIEAAQLGYGEPLSPAVSAAVGPAVETACGILVQAGATGSRHSHGSGGSPIRVTRGVDP